MPFIFLPPEYRAEFVLPSARLSPRTFCGPVHLSRSRTLCLPGFCSSPCLAVRYCGLTVGPGPAPGTQHLLHKALLSE